MCSILKELINGGSPDLSQKIAIPFEDEIKVNTIDGAKQ